MWQERLDFTLKNNRKLIITNANIWQGGLEFEQAVSSENQFELGATHIGQMVASLASKAEHNLLPYPFYQTTRTVNGVTFTDNGDGTITVNGTATATCYFYCHRDSAQHAPFLDTGEYIMSGCPQDGSYTGYSMYMYINEQYLYDYGSGRAVSVDADDTEVAVVIQIANGATVNNLTFQPMIRTADDADDEFEPYYASHLSDYDFDGATCVLTVSDADKGTAYNGVYTVVSCQKDNGTVNITAYDNMHKLSEPYTTALTFPTTYGDMANEICGRTMTFDGSTTAVATKPEGEDLTKREVLGYIAQACGYNVLCDSNGQFQFVRYDLPGFNTSGSYHVVTDVYDLHHSQYPVAITGVKVIVHTIVDSMDATTGEVTSQDVTREYTAGTDDYQIVIEDNPLITTANGQTVADLIFATYGGVAFYTGTVSHASDLSMQASDIMKVTDRTGTTFNMLVSAVRFSTGSAQSTGSYAEEPTSKTSVQPTETSRLQTSIRQAQIEARNSRQLANNTNQYFWHTQSGSDTGAHITEIPREDFLADPANGGGNLLARSNGVAIRDGLTEIAQFTGREVAFYDGEGTAAENMVATFGSNGSTLGKTDDNHLEMNGLGLTGVDSNGDVTFDIQFANIAGVAEVTERSKTLTNSNTDKSSFQNFTLTPKNDPAERTQIAYALIIDVVCGETTLTEQIDFSREYDSSSQGIYVQTNSVSWRTNGVQYQLRADMHWNDYSKGATFRNISFTTGSGIIKRLYVETTLQADTSTTPSYTFGTRTDSKQQTGAYSFTSGEANSAKGASAHAHGIGLIATSYAQTVIGKYNAEDAYNQYAFIIGNGTDDSNRSNALAIDWFGHIIGSVQSYTPTYNESPYLSNCSCVVSAGICHLSYRGEAKAHAVNDVIMNLPVDARPTFNVWVPFLKNTDAQGTVRIGTDGNVTIMSISSTTNTSRIYFNCSFPVV
jgi:hypothetical protein